MPKLAILNDANEVEAMVEVPAEFLAFKQATQGGEGDSVTQTLRCLQALSRQWGMENYRNFNSEFWRYHAQRAGVAVEEASEQGLRWLLSQPDKPAE